MKNKKAIIILSVLILLFLIGSVSANDVNTTDVSASDTDDVTGTVTVDSTDENYVNDLTDESEDLNDSEILSASSDENFIFQNDGANDLKENTLYNYHDDKSDYNNVSSSSNSEILAMNKDNNLLGLASSATASFEGNKLKITYTNLYEMMFGQSVCEIAVGISTASSVDLPNDKYDDITVSDSISAVFHSGTAIVNNYNFVPGKTYYIIIAAMKHGTYAYSVSGSDNRGWASLSVVGPRATPSISVSDTTIIYAATNQNVAGTVKSGSTNVDSGSITLKYGTKTIGSGTVSNGAFSAIITDSTFAQPSTTAYDITVEYGGNSNYANASKTGKITVNKITPTISVESQSVYYGQTNMPTMSGTVYSTTGNYYSGTVDLYINNQLVKSGIAVSNAGSWSYTLTSLPDLNPGSYDVKIAYSGSTYANSKTETKTGIYTVNKNTPDISAGQNTISYGQSNDVIISGTIRNPNVSNVYGGAANITIGNMTWNDVVVNDDGSWTVPGFSSLLYTPGTYNIGVVYSGNDYTMAKTAENAGTLTVNKGMLFVMATNTGNIDFGDSEIVTVSVMNYARIPIENINVKLTGDGIQDYLINTTNSEGKLTFTVPGLIRGQYNNWELEITGNEYYEDYPFQYPVNPFNVQSPLNVFITSISPNNSTYPEEIIVTGFTDADQIPQGNVSLTIGDKTYTGFFNSTGNFTASLIGVKPGTYNNITAKYNPTEEEFYYRGVEGTVSIQETGMVIC